jgi:Tol biopolymer transport system component/predicted Ser/Thr protein kinase
MTSVARGQRLGPYEVLERIGAGGMGEVWKARDTRLDRIVAVKVSNEQFSERFEREARAVAALNHPNICTLHDVGPNYLVMEHIEGQPLKGPLPVAQVVEYAGQILEALDVAHRKGITHRDLKPANILVTRQGIKLLDFGLAKQSGPLQQTDATLTEALTSKGQIVGTLQYMAPEQLQGNDTDPRSDLFAFGCVLYEMLSGKRAFEGQSAASVIAAILEREPAPLDLRPSLERVIRICLAKDPAQRFQNALDLKRDLIWASEQPVAVKTNRQTRITLAAALALGSVAGWSLSHFRRPAADGHVLRLQIDPPPGGRFVFDGAVAGDLAVSPDGKMVAYSASVNGKIGLWVRPLDGSAATLLPGTEDAGQPFWSPNSKSLGFVVLNSRLYRAELGGGSPIQICNPVLTMRAGTWGSDGNILFTGLISGKNGVYRVPASGGTPSLLVAPDSSRGEFAYRWPQVLPDGRFLYFVEGNRPETSGIYAASLTKPAERVKLLATTIRAVYASAGDGKDYFLWVRAGALVAQELNPRTLQLSGEPHVVAAALNSTAEGGMHVAASGTGLLLYGAFGEVSRFSWFDRTGTLLKELGEPAAQIFMFRLSPDERHIAVQHGTYGGSDLWMLDTDRGVSSRFTSDLGHSTQAVWSPDSRVILFVQLGHPDILRKAASRAGDAEVVVHRPVAVMPTDWSGDGRWVLTSESGADTKYDIWKIPMTPDGRAQEGSTPTPYLRTRFNEFQARFSPEPSPRWVAYTSDESGRSEVYLDAFPEPRARVRISIAGGQSPQWATGGRELFYVSPENKLMAVGLKLGADGVEPLAPRELFQLHLRSSAGPMYQPSRDGQRILVVTSPEVAPQPLTIIVNWPALLKEAAP